MFTRQEPQLTWQVLDAGSIWMKEFASALSEIAITTVWSPAISPFGHWQKWERLETVSEPALQLTHFPLQRGYARPILGKLLPFERRLIPRLESRSRCVTHSALICTTPFYAPVAERWRGPVVYYVTDLTKKYASCNEAQVVALDRRLCEAATLVCPNSSRIREYLVSEAGCDPGKIVRLPNATRLSNIPELPLLSPADLPDPLSHLERPVAGVIGNLAGNMDWLLLKDAIAKTPHISWVFVGPSTMDIPDERQSAARKWCLQEATFTGPKPYGELQSYARCFDVAVLPYRKHEPTYSGSSTRFYEHLAASRPMIGTRGFAELLEKEPLIKLVDTASELADAIEYLESTGFSDGLEADRWAASKYATWQNRARTMVTACDRALHASV